ncbi:MAG: hypothetical protein NVSMB42_00760 [Herpetosiphon sp.]
MANTENHIWEVTQARVSRRNALKGVGAALAALTVASVNPIANGQAFAASTLQGLSDLDILNFALTLEHLEATFYKMAVASGKLSGQALTILTAIGDHENQHVAALTSVITKLGGTPAAAAAKYNFGSMASQAEILATAETLEGVGVGAYTGAAPLIKDRAGILPSAASIEQVESRHFAAIRFLRNENPTPEAFGPSLSVADVLKAVKPILGSA